ncbi:MAG: DUF4389 domain-containing protein [Rubrimonas sp.]
MTDSAVTDANRTQDRRDGVPAAAPVGGLARLFYGLVYLLLYNAAEIAIFALALVQALIALFGRGPSAALGRLGAHLGRWMKSMVDFTTGAADAPAFPFGPWPAAERDRP